MKLFLFDLDGTLVTTGGAGLRALDKAFLQLFGIKNAVQNINPSGKTDPAIFREMIHLHFQRDILDREKREMTETYLQYLDLEMKMAKKKEALLGVIDFLNHLKTRNDVLVGLGTGNLEKGARLKLAPMDLNDYFPFGGFGSDAEDRAEVLQYGRRRGESEIGQTISSTSVFVIGDTPLDVAAARRNGFKAVAVASGGATWDELKATKPDFLLENMTEGLEFLRYLDNVSSTNVL